MKLIPANSAPFIGASLFSLNEVKAGTPVILGYGYDGTTSFRSGTRRGPDGLRAVSDAGIETYSPLLDKDLEDLSFADIGNLDIPYGAPEPVINELYEATKEILKIDAKPIILGGEHSISSGAVRAAFEKHPDLIVIQFDAHADLRETWNGNKNSHACTMRRILDFLPAEQLLQVGIRSGTREEFQEMRQSGRLITPSAESLQTALKPFLEAPLYITFDLDIFDPQLVPGTGTPEPGGIDWKTFEELLSCFKESNIIGLDIVELAPSLDSTEVSSVVAAKLLRELILTIT